MRLRVFIIILAVISTLALLSGCETAKGLVKGICKDSKNTWNNLWEADEWMKEHLW